MMHAAAMPRALPGPASAARGRHCTDAARPPAPPGRQSGFSVVELVIVLVIASLLVALAAPNMGIFFRNADRTTRINDLVTAIQFTRSQAVSRNQRVTLCAVDLTTFNAADPSGGECIETGEFDRGWIVFINPDGDDDIDDEGETVLRVFQTEDLPGSSFVGTDDEGPVGAISYLGTGMADSLGAGTHVLYCDDRSNPDTSARAVILTTGSGQPRVSMDTNDDGIDNLTATENFSC